MKKIWLTSLILLCIISITTLSLSIFEVELDFKFDDSNLSNTGESELEHETTDSSAKFSSNYTDNNSKRYIRNFFKQNITWLEEKNKNINYSRNIYEITRFKGEIPSKKHIEDAWNLYRSTYESAKNNSWFDYHEAKEDEFNNTYSVDHYVNLDYYRDEATLKPERPEFLIFRNNSEGEKVLAGVMYMLNDVNEEGRQIGGPITKWHYHTYPDSNCYYNGFAASTEDVCPDSYYSKKSPEMLHVWFIDHPGGTFATNMYVPDKALNSGAEMMNKSEFIKKLEIRFGKLN